MYAFQVTKVLTNVLQIPCSFMLKTIRYITFRNCLYLLGMKKRVAEWIQSVLGSEAEKTVATTPDFGRNWKMASAITPTTVPGFVIPKLDEGKLRNGSTRSEDSEDSLSLSVDSSEEMFTPVVSLTVAACTGWKNCCRYFLAVKLAKIICISV